MPIWPPRSQSRVRLGWPTGASDKYVVASSGLSLRRTLVFPEALECVGSVGSGTPNNCHPHRKRIQRASVPHTPAYGKTKQTQTRDRRPAHNGLHNK
ncbi:thiamin pyrimidine pyrophosphate hydrolase [Anopheles sinensis]|uniref:Thiamin pyrimidine pyrophosphate hydrolase n=1 Tax=Anopheles sinensis TaxID=74873 RepID=A0A084WDR2_ANOSI|nr:thiamin pyrimidine pyrophosphate hydrolase [Anopheles sinensis]